MDIFSIPCSNVMCNEYYTYMAVFLFLTLHFYSFLLSSEMAKYTTASSWHTDLIYVPIAYFILYKPRYIYDLSLRLTGEDGLFVRSFWHLGEDLLRHCQRLWKAIPLELCLLWHHSLNVQEF